LKTGPTTLRRDSNCWSNIGTARTARGYEPFGSGPGRANPDPASQVAIPRTPPAFRSGAPQERAAGRFAAPTTYEEMCESLRSTGHDDLRDCVPASGVTPLRVMLCVVHYAVRACVVSITPLWAGRVVRTVGSDGVSMAMDVSDR
jgi:hypothetical protein